MIAVDVGGAPALSRAVIERLSGFANPLSPAPELPPILLIVLVSRFREYRRGDFSRELMLAMDGKLPGKDERSFRYYHLHYVDQRKVVHHRKDKDGNTYTETEIVYDHSDRYSIVVPGCSVKDVLVCSDRSIPIDWAKVVSWKSALDEFNSKFTIVAATEIAGVKFASPATILRIQKMGELLRGLNIEFSHDGEMCVSFDNADLLIANHIKETLEHPAQFIDAIKSGVELQAFNQTLELILQLAEDNSGPL